MGHVNRLFLLCVLVCACTATPITIPAADGISTSKDGAPPDIPFGSVDGADDSHDKGIKKDVESYPEDGLTVLLDAALDFGPAEAGPTEAGPPDSWPEAAPAGLEAGDGG